MHLSACNNNNNSNNKQFRFDMQAGDHKLSGVALVKLLDMIC